MKKYRKLPVVIEAMQFTNENKDRIFNWVSSFGSTRWGEASFDDSGKPIMIIHTLEGDMIVKFGDWVIKGVEGEFYPCKDSIFKATYEEAESEE